MLVPAMQSIGTCSSSSTLSTPTCAPPFAPPPASTRPMRGREAGCCSCACKGSEAASNAAATTSAFRARASHDNDLDVMPPISPVGGPRAISTAGIDCGRLEAVTQLQYRPEILHVVSEPLRAAAMVVVEVDESVAEGELPTIRMVVDGVGL